MEKPYVLIKKKNRNIQVRFAHMPDRVISTGTKDQREAILFAESILEKDWRLINKKPENITLRRFARNFFGPTDPKGIRERNELRNRNYDELYYKNHQARLNNYILPAFGGYSLTAITAPNVEDWFLGLNSSYTGKKLSANTKNKILKCFQIVMGQAVRENLIAENPVKEIAIINENDGNCREPFTPSELEVMFPEDPAKLLELWGGLWWTTYFLILRDTGWRPGEVLGLKRTNYYPEQYGIYTTGSVTKGEYKNSIKTTNRGQKYKVGILTDITIKFLEKLIIVTQGEFLFTTERGFPSNEGINKHLRKVLDQLEIPIKGRTQYSLRHSFETALAGRVEDRILLELMAHTGFRPEYDHRTPEDILKLLQPVKMILENRID